MCEPLISKGSDEAWEARVLQVPQHNILREKHLKLHKIQHIKKSIKSNINQHVCDTGLFLLYYLQLFLFFELTAPTLPLLDNFHKLFLYSVVSMWVVILSLYAAVKKCLIFSYCDALFTVETVEMFTKLYDYQFYVFQQFREVLNRCLCGSA